MSAPRHTASPWHACYDADDDGGIVYGQEGGEVAVTRGWGSAGRADCDLIAAAPDLLAACEAALLACLPGASDDQRRECWNAARAAIAKAKGETP